MKVRNRNFRHVYLIFLLYLGVFWSWIQSRIRIFTYWDEIIALEFLLIFLISILLTGKLKIRKDDFRIFIGTSFFCAGGIVSNYLNGYADWWIAYQDLFINLKFLLIMYFVMKLYSNTDVLIYKIKLAYHIKIITIFLFLLFVLDKMFGFFSVYEVRFGIQSEQLFFTHPTYAAAAIVFLILGLFLFGNLNKFSDFICFIILVFLEIFTLRFKAIAVTICLCVIYLYFVVMKLKKLTLWMIGLLAVVILFICYDQIYFYFLSEQAKTMPRGAILYTSLYIAKDYFPFGTGFATFGSYLSVSGKYSPVYGLYQVNHIYGMTADNFAAANDQYWPTILGQTGVFGMMAQIYVFIILYKKIKVLKTLNLSKYIAALGAFVYILVSSTSESSIVNPVTIPLAIILGLCFSGKVETT